MLNKEQKEAVELIDRPLVVIAGPGTGKTTLITEKISYLIENQNFSGEEILALTFTQKAAEEMSSRVEVSTESIFNAKTFHSFALEIIENHSSSISRIDKDYRFIEENDVVSFFLENLDSIDLKSVEIKNNRYNLASDLASSISKLKDFGYGQEDIKKLEMNDDIRNDIFNAYKQYEKYKEKNNFVDFADMLLIVLELLEKDESIRNELRSKYKYILVDEFQDTNKVQLEIIKLLASENITIVGDQKQSIYAFRGANYKNLDDFKVHFFNYKDIFLHENYRSSQILVENYNKIIKKISSEKELLKFNTKNKGEIEISRCSNENSQYSYIINTISKLKHKNPDSTIAVLTRRKLEAQQISKKLSEFGIDHYINNQSSFLHDSLVKLVMSYLDAIAAPKEANNSLFDILSSYSLRNETIRKICRKSSMKKSSIYDVLKGESLVDFEEEKELVKKIVANIDSLASKYISGLSIESIFQEIVSMAKLYQKAIANKNVQSIDALNSLSKLINSFTHKYRTQDINQLLKYIQTCKNIDIFDGKNEIKKDISLLTVHQSKGMEFDHILIPYLNDKKFPSMNKSSKFEAVSQSKDEFLNEELRLFFVALTRAKESVHMSYVKKYSDNKFDSKPSEFLKFLGLKEINYTHELESFCVENNDIIKNEVMDKIHNYIVNDEFDLAKREVELLRSLFSKKDLTSFIGSSEHPDYKLYVEKLNSKNDSLVEIVPEKMIYSVSQLKTYESCPQKYLYQYIYKIPGSSKHYFDFGTSVHSVLEDILPEFSSMPKEALYAKAISMLHQKWISKGYESAQQEREYFEKGVDAIKHFIEKQKEFENEDRQTLSLEEKFLIDISGKKLLGFIDRIDKVNGEIEILDYKTSNSMESTQQLKKNMQLYVYALAAKERFGRFPKKVGLWYLIHDKIAQIDFNERSLDEVKSQIVELVKGIENKQFNPKTSFFACKFCDFNNICPQKKLD